MLRDPDMLWEDGEFPYDALSEAGITPHSTLEQVRQASYELIERDNWSASTRAAWDRLRLVEPRLWVDFLMYPGDPESLAAALAGLAEEALSGEAEGWSPLGPPWHELEHMDGDFDYRRLREPVMRQPASFGLCAPSGEVQFDD